MGRLGFLADIHKEEIKELVQSIRKIRTPLKIELLINVESNKTRIWNSQLWIK